MAFHLPFCKPMLSCFLALLLSVLSANVFGQSCDCPPIAECGACQGGITELTIRNNGLTALITAYDAGGIRFLGWVNSGDTFTVTGSNPTGSFSSNELNILVVGFPVTSLTTSCGGGLLVNSTVGSYTIAGGRSRNGGALCCIPSDIDTIKPTFSNCPTNISATLPGPGCSMPISWTPPTVTDNCGEVVVTSTYSPNDNFTRGITTVQYTATDNYGNTATCAFNVTVTGNSSPVLSACPANITVNANASCKATVNWTPPSTVGNCVPVTLSSTRNPGTVFNLGTTPVTYTVVDQSGNATSCSFNVTVVDNTKPVISGCIPSSITISADASCQATVNWTVPTATDNCSGVSMVGTHTPGSKFPIGTTPVTYTATDAAGNFRTCTFNVIVRDQLAPVFSEQSDIVVKAGQGCQTQVTWTPPTTTDCNAVTLSTSHNPGSSFSVGNTEVIYTAIDNQGNRATLKFNVIVTDEKPPVFQNCVDDIVVMSNENCEATVSWEPPTASDNCSVTQFYSTHNPGALFGIGETEVKYTAKDANDNVTICRFKVVVQNETLPVFTNCPETIELKGNEAGEAYTDWIEPAATTICGDVVITSSHSPGSRFSLGTTRVEYTAEDETGKRSTCSFNVVVTREEIELDISKVVTPDGDGINDFWTVINIEKFKDNKIVIVDRWGSVIFSATGYNNEGIVWNGDNRNGNAAPTGTYFFTISVRYGPASFEKTGFIELIR